MSERENLGADDERESMWSVPRRFKSVYFPLFYLLGIIGTSWSVWYEASRISSGQSYQDVANAAVQKLPAVFMGAAFTSLVITEAIMVIAGMLEDYYKRRNDRIRAEGVAEGIAEGKAQRDHDWEVWFESYRYAQEHSLPFDEPPPSSRSENGTNNEMPTD